MGGKFHSFFFSAKEASDSGLENKKEGTFFSCSRLCFDVVSVLRLFVLSIARAQQETSKPREREISGSNCSFNFRSLATSQSSLGSLAIFSAQAKMVKSSVFSVDIPGVTLEVRFERGREEECEQDGRGRARGANGENCGEGVSDASWGSWPLRTKLANGRLALRKPLCPDHRVLE